MPTWCQKVDEHPQAALDLIEGYLHRVDRPTYLGTLSLLLGRSLKHTQEMVDTLEERGIVKRLSEEDKRSMGLPPPAHLYVLVAPAHPSRAKW